MNTNNEENKSAESDVAPTPQTRCGYCGSTSPTIPYEEMYGQGVVGHDCCPDCGGV